MPMTSQGSARNQAEFASFQAFIACYLREVQAGKWINKSDWAKRNALEIKGEAVLLLSVANPHTEFALDVHYRSLCGRHCITRAYRKQDTESEALWQPESLWSVLMFLVRDLYHRNAHTHKRKQLELIWRLSDSLQNMERYIAFWQRALQHQTLNTFLDYEQCLPLGHWMHPTPKSRQGCTDWQQAQFSPELQGQFQLHLFAVERKLVQQASAVNKPCEQILAEIFALEVKRTHCLLPLHPLQAQWLLAQNWVQQLKHSGQIIDLGLSGPGFYATSSMRTVYHPDLDWMLKLSIPVKLTNSLRQNKLHELHAGVRISSLFTQLNLAEIFPRLQFIHDPAYMTLVERIKDDAQANTKVAESGFECILRENPFKGNSRNIFSIASLSQTALMGEKSSLLRTLVENFSQHSKFSLGEAGLFWFKHYWDCAIEPCITLFDRFGIALEAHQQNILLKVDKQLPAQAWFRDNQGYYLCEERKTQLAKLVPELAETPEVFFPTEHVIERFCYYLIINQLFALIYRMGEDTIVDEARLLRIVVNRLRDLEVQCSERGRALCHYLLHSPTLASKANLLTRVKDIDELEAEHELAIYAQIENPIAAHCREVHDFAHQTEREYAW